jgi:Calcineurin-like phosphoesterase
MGTPRIMIRFRDENHPAIEEHNDVFVSKGRAFWGLWLKSFEDEAKIVAKLGDVEDEPIYIADTASKAKPSVYICDVKRVVTNRKSVDRAYVPEYYRNKISDVSIWFELASKIQQIDATSSLTNLLGVPTVYFLDYDDKGKIINSAPQRDFQFAAADSSSFVLHLSDIHIGDDHAFRYPVESDKSDVDATRTLSDVLFEDLNSNGALGKIGCVVISGDIVTKGGWSKEIEVSKTTKMTGLALARLLLDDLSKKIGVPANLFFMVPGNHDIVRQSGGGSEAVQEYLLHYDHESGFRTLREEFCEIYKLSPLNYTARVRFKNKTVVLGLLNSAYLNEKVTFSEYGFVGDDADKVFSVLAKADAPDAVKILGSGLIKSTIRE